MNVIISFRRSMTTHLVTHLEEADELTYNAWQMQHICYMDTKLVKFHMFDAFLHCSRTDYECACKCMLHFG